MEDRNKSKTELSEIGEFGLIDRLTKDLKNKNMGGEKNNVRKVKNKTVTDLLLAKNPRNSYPIYRTLQQSEHFTKKELVSFFALFGDTDKRLKTTGQNPKFVLEDMVIQICRKVVS